MIPLLGYFFPEVAGLSLEGIDELFAGGQVKMRRSVHAEVGHSALDGALKDVEKDGSRDSYLERA